MGFGHSLHFDSSSENNFTFDIIPIKECFIECDDKQQPRFYATHNHPQVLQAPHSFHLFGTHNDTLNIYFSMIMEMNYFIVLVIRNISNFKKSSLYEDGWIRLSQWSI